jgi:hypothetical protein
VISYALLAVVVAWLAGLGVVAGLWHRRAPLPMLAWLGLAGLLGPFMTGAALLLAGCAGLDATTSAPIIATVSIGAGLAGAWRRLRKLPRAPRLSVALVLSVLLAIGWIAWLASRTHLGWDGTVVWYHKARIIAASDGRMPTATLADPTRIWMAPDYPLHVPLAMAWVRLWQPVEDERAMKVLPAAWCAALLLLVTAGVIERSSSPTRAACALLLVSASPRLLIGEGSYTSGYADGPLAGLLATLVWLVWRDGDDDTFGWVPLAAVVAVAVAWTKQEGVIAALAAGAACAWQHRFRPGCDCRPPLRVTARRALAIAAPALTLVVAWQVWAGASGAATTMAYAWPGADQALARVPLIAGAYAETWTDVRTWGVLWPGLSALLIFQRHRLPVAPTAVVAAMAAAGALAFLVSGWPDVRAHLLVTTPRLLIGLVPAVLVIALGMRDRDAAA